MQDVHTVIVAIVAFIVLVGLMVVVHEFGHFVVAKLCGVRVESFSVGFGPRLFGIKYGETDYKISLLPLGGYVKMTGEAPEQNLETPGTEAAFPPDDLGSFLNHPRWQRMLIGLAGPTANFILAFVLMLFYFGWINEVPAVEVKDTTVDWVVPGSAAAETGIEPGDTILRFADADHPDWEKVDEILNLNSKQTVPVTVERRGKVLQLALHVPSELNDEDLAGMLPQLLPGPIGVVKVEPETPAEQAGLRAGDAIQSVDGHPFHYVTSLLAYMQTGQGKPISLVILRNGAVLAPILAHPAKLDDGWKLGFVPQAPSYRRDPLPLGRAVNKSAAFFADKSIAILDVLRGLFTHKVAISHLAGPVGIARVAGDAAESKGWMAKIWLAAFISINLGIINLLPFPILDGGGIIFLLIESVMRRDINIVVKERIYQAAFVVLVTFFVFITFNDITKLPIFTHLKP